MIQTDLLSTILWLQILQPGGASASWGKALCDIPSLSPWEGGDVEDKAPGRGHTPKLTHMRLLDPPSKPNSCHFLRGALPDTPTSQPFVHVSPKAPPSLRFGVSGE